MNKPLIVIKGPTDHFSEIVLLSIIAGGVLYVMHGAIAANHAGEASAYTAILMAIVSAIKERWTQRSLDRMGQSLANAPAIESAAPEVKP